MDTATRSAWPSGEVLLTGYRWDRSQSDEDFNIYNPVTLGAVPCDALLFRSKDDGRTWSPPQIVPAPEGVAMAQSLRAHRSP